MYSVICILGNYYLVINNNSLSVNEGCSYIHTCKQTSPVSKFQFYSLYNVCRMWSCMHELQKYAEKSSRFQLVSHHNARRGVRRGHVSVSSHFQKIDICQTEKLALSYSSPVRTQVQGHLHLTCMYNTRVACMHNIIKTFTSTILHNTKQHRHT